MQCMLWLDLLWLFFFIVAKVVDSTWYCFWLRLCWGSKWTEPLLEGKVKTLGRVINLVSFKMCSFSCLVANWYSRSGTKHYFALKKRLRSFEEQTIEKSIHYQKWVKSSQTMQLKLGNSVSDLSTVHAHTHTQTHSYINGKPTHPSHWMHKLN